MTHLIPLLLALALDKPAHGERIEAPTFPYLATLTWTAPADGSAASYNCYLDGALVVNVTGTTCQESVATAGLHTFAVTSVNPTYLFPESDPVTLAVTVAQPSKGTGLKAK